MCVCVYIYIYGGVWVCAFRCVCVYTSYILKKKISAYNDKHI